MTVIRSRAKCIDSEGHVSWCTFHSRSSCEICVRYCLIACNLLQFRLCSLHRLQSGKRRKAVYVVADSVAWYENSKDGSIVCANCVWKYHGAVRIVPLEPASSNAEPPPFMFRPVKEEQDNNWKHVRVISVPCFILSYDQWASFDVIGRNSVVT